MNHLYRELAPISAAAWQEIEQEAKRTLKTTCAARKLVDFDGPKGWEASAVSTGRSKPIDPPSHAKLHARLRRVLPLVELRVPFELQRDELDAVDRGAKDMDTDPVIEAARAIAIAEDHAVFHGYKAAGIEGICEGAADAAIPLGDDYAAYPALVTTALNRLRDAGVGWTDRGDGRRLPGPGTCAAADRWPAGVGAGRGRRRGAVNARQGLRADGRAGLLHRLSRSRCGTCAAVHRGELHVLADLPTGGRAAGISHRGPGVTIETEAAVTVTVVATRRNRSCIIESGFCPTGQRRAARQRARQARHGVRHGVGVIALRAETTAQSQ
jgi:hypothetical protein